MSTKTFLCLAIIISLAFLLAPAGAQTAGGLIARQEGFPLDPVDYLPLDPLIAAEMAFFLVLGITLISMAFQNKLTDRTKKLFFVIVALSVGLTTIYAAATTIYLNVISESGGPVHWHADFEVWVCGEQLSGLKNAQFPSNKVGTSVLHHHDDFRMHVEGLVISKEDVSLGKFFNAIGGNFTGNSMTVLLNDGSVNTFSNNDKCPDGQPGKWRLFVKNFSTGEFEENPKLDNHIIKPFFNVPPGDFLKIVFDSKGGAPDGS